MKAAILTMGVRGDVEPYLALGLGLRRAGHDVLIATHRDFEDDIRAHSFDFHPLPGSSDELSTIFASVGIGRVAMLQSWRRLADFATPLIRELWNEAHLACLDADVVVHSMLTSFIAQHIAKMNGQVSIGSLLYPIFTPTKELPVPMLAGGDYGPKLNYFSHSAFNWITNTFSRSAYSLVRRSDPGLPPAPDWPYGSGPDGPALVLYAFSPSIIPPPSDWDESRVVTGYWQLERSPSWQPDPSLLTFIGEGSRPIYIGFGSMSRTEHISVIMEAVEAVYRHGHRGVIQVAAEKIAGRTLPDGFIRVDYVPHEWLFPHMAALIHHGGAGTTAAGLRAGVPMVVVPFYGDQPFWGRLVQRRTGGPAPIPRRQLSKKRLQQALQDALAEPVQTTAAALGRIIQSENGVSEAVSQIERAVR